MGVIPGVDGAPIPLVLLPLKTRKANVLTRLSLAVLLMTGDGEEAWDSTFQKLTMAV